MMEALVARVVDFCARRAWLIVVLVLAMTVAAGSHVYVHLKMDTNTTSMIADDLAWKQELARFNQLFPTNSGLLVVVIDGRTPDLAEDAAVALSKALAVRTDLFASVRRPDGGPYFDRVGLLLLSTEDLRRVAQSIIRAQPFIASLAADPSSRGLFEVLTLALTGLSAGVGDITHLERPMAAIANAMSNAFAGDTTPLSWRALMIDQPIGTAEFRKLILTQPVRDFTSLQPGAMAAQFIRETAQNLDFTPAAGVTVRLTGPVALSDEEFSTVSEGTGWALALSATLVLGLLFLALRGFRPVAAAYVTLAVGLVLTLFFATISIGSLNLISVAFVVMFIGLSIDFSIQFAVRLAQERFIKDHPDAVIRTATAMARPLSLAAIATASGFLAFIPTEYRGVSELGLIAGAGMGLTLVLNLTLLPALLQILRPRGKSLDMGYAWAQAPDRFIQRHRLPVILVWCIPAAVGAFAISRLSFDFNPLHLKDPEVESVSTMRDLMRDPLHVPYNIEIVAPSLEEAETLAQRLRNLPEVYDAITINRLIPSDQTQKLAVIADAADLLGPSLDPFDVSPPPDAEEIRQSLRGTAIQLRQLTQSSDTARQLARLLDQAAGTGDEFLRELDWVLVASLPGRLAQLAAALNAEPVTLESVPPEIRNDWLAPGGEARLAVFPDGNSDDNSVMARFVGAVREVTPLATGPAVQILESGKAVAHAFQTASWLALGAMATMLLLVLRRLRDAALVLAPLLVSALVTALLCWWLNLTLNFANVIALPLLLGIGVAFNIYFVINWRGGVSLPLGTSTARAVLFSAMTTAASFGSLALSNHMGTAGMGLLLLIGLGVIVLATFSLLPALLGPAPRGPSVEG